MKAENTTSPAASTMQLHNFLTQPQSRVNLIKLTIVCEVNLGIRFMTRYCGILQTLFSI